MRIEWEAQEDGAALTSFVVDDVAIVVEGSWRPSEGIPPALMQVGSASTGEPMCG